MKQPLWTFLTLAAPRSQVRRPSRAACCRAFAAPRLRRRLPCVSNARISTLWLFVLHSMSNRAAHAVQSIGHLGDDDLEYSGVMDALELANRVRAQDVLIDTLKSPRSLPVIGWLLRGACWQTLPRIANDPGLRASTRSCSSASSSAMGSGVTAGGATSRVSIFSFKMKLLPAEFMLSNGEDELADAEAGGD